MTVAIADTDDPCELLADLICELLNNTPDEKGIVVTAANPENPDAELYSEDRRLRVLAIPGEETETRIGAGGQVEVVYPVNLTILGGVSLSEYTRRELSAYAWRRRRVLRRTALGDATRRFRYAGAEVLVKFDVDHLHDGDDFFHVAQINYRGTE